MANPLINTAANNAVVEFNGFKWKCDATNKVWTNVGPVSATKVTDLVVLGASIEDYSLSDSTEIAQLETFLLQKCGHAVTVYECSTPGYYTSNSNNNFATDTAVVPTTKNAATTLAIIHTGGNNVTDNVPYTSTQDATVIASMISDINSLIDKVEARDWRWCLADLSFRNYNGTTINNEYMGSLPYTLLVQQTISRSRRSLYQYTDGTSWLDFYNLIKNNYAAWLQADNVHLTQPVGETGFRNFIAEVVACIDKGTVPVQIKKSTLIRSDTPPLNPVLGEKYLTSTGVVNEYNGSIWSTVGTSSNGVAPSLENTSRALVAADNQKVIHCSNNPTFTINAGMAPAWSVPIRGLCTFSAGVGVTIIDERTSGASSSFCVLHQSPTLNVFILTGSKA